MTTDPSTPDASLVEEIVLRFEQAWQRGYHARPRSRAVSNQFIRRCGF